MPVRILYVDDDPTSLRVRADLLAEYDHLEVVTATSVTEGRRHLSRSRIDCVLSDVEMEPEDGIAFLKSVRSDDPELPFLLFSDAPPRGVIEAAIADGMTDYVPKSLCTVSYDLVVNRIENAVEHYRIRHRL